MKVQIILFKYYHLNDFSERKFMKKLVEKRNIQGCSQRENFIYKKKRRSQINNFPFIYIYICLYIT